MYERSVWRYVRNHGENQMTYSVIDVPFQDQCMQALVLNRIAESMMNKHWYRTDNRRSSRQNPFNDLEKHSFIEVYEKLRDEKNDRSEDVEIYTKANLKPTTFHRLRSEQGRADISAGKARDAVFALAVAMRLDLQQTERLLNSIGQSMKGNLSGRQDENREDEILKYISNGNGDIWVLNDYLHDQDLKPLGDL